MGKHKGCGRVCYKIPLEQALRSGSYMIRSCESFTQLRNFSGLLPTLFYIDGHYGSFLYTLYHLNERMVPRSSYYLVVSWLCVLTYLVNLVITVIIISFNKTFYKIDVTQIK